MFTEKVATDAATGKVVVTAKLSPGIYRAEFEMPAAGDTPAVKARRTIEVLAASSTRYGVKRPLTLVAERLVAQPGSEFRALCTEPPRPWGVEVTCGFAVPFSITSAIMTMVGAGVRGLLR